MKIIAAELSRKKIFQPMYAHHHSSCGKARNPAYAVNFNPASSVCRQHYMTFPASLHKTADCADMFRIDPASDAAKQLI
ncbi:hypothetical protein [Nitrosospira sp. Nsp1]|uniref:hypothetical protein n=1 Tax=Nitrosospira sp. Nsp1 TaxID=136547 RepID=UPI00115F8C83|nr:hypothetical protein [Nitrosospira sp. Nsp1]